MTRSVVIVGGGWAGTALAHLLLAKTYPALHNFKITLISASSHAYWNLAAPRAFVSDSLPEDQLFVSLEDGFQDSPPESIDIVIGTATKLDNIACTVEVKTASDAKSIKYDYLVLATGSSYESDLPFKTVSDYPTTTQALAKMRQKIAAAKSIVVAGAGHTGVELVGEIAAAYGREKSIFHVLGAKHPLPQMRDDIRLTAEGLEEALGATMVPDATVLSTIKTEDGRTEVELSDGSTIITDLYIPALGLRANTSYLPPSMLDELQQVKVDDHLRASGIKNVFAIGDVSGQERNSIFNVEYQATYLATKLDKILKLGKGGDAGPIYVNNHVSIEFVTVGPKQGTGRLSFMKMPSFAVSLAKGKNFNVDKSPTWVKGQGLLFSRPLPKN